MDNLKIAIAIKAPTITVTNADGTEQIERPEEIVEDQEQE